MPRKNGREVNEEVQRMNSEAKVLVTSGYPPDMVPRHDNSPARPDFIAKPLTPRTLLRTIRAVLDT